MRRRYILTDSEAAPRPLPPPRWPRRLLLGAAVLAGLLVVGPILGLALWAWRTAGALDLGRLQETSVIYADGRILAPGVSVDAADLAGSLRRLGYRETREAPARPGQHRRAEGEWAVFLRALDDPAARRDALAVRLALDGPRITEIATAAGERLDEVQLEPEPLAGLGEAPSARRDPVPLSAVPAHVVQAVLAAEDHRFREHPGVDVRAVLRAVWVNLRRGAVTQGGSTLTQQLVKNAVLTPRRTWARKLREAAIAVALERRYGKDEILAAYLNGVYLGQHGSLAIYGVGAAARTFFGKEVERLTPGEAAMLAGIIRAPNTYSPVNHPARARERRDLVLRRMRELGMLDEQRHAQALAERVSVQRGAPPRLVGPYFTDWVQVQVEALQPPDESPAGGLRVYTSLDPALQRAAEAAIARGLDRLEGHHRHLRREAGGSRLQAALVALDARTGQVRAMVGGRDYGLSQFNRATQARRQPGSAFKPFVYLAALGGGARGEPPHFTPASLLEDRPLTVGAGRRAWTPRNYEGRYEGTVTVRRALEQSLNAATVWMAEAVGFDAVVRAARGAGIVSPLQALPAVVLGSFEVTPLELAAAYVPLAGSGDRVAPSAIRAVVDGDGVVTGPAVTRTPAVRPDEAFLVTHLLQGVVDRGTGAAARALGVEGPVAGKTGTTNEGRDAWFVGYTPRLVALVWVGFDERDVLRLSGGQAALPIWADFMRTAMAVVPAGPFVPPESVVFAEVDPVSGHLATAWCPVTAREAFLATSAPREPCRDHGPPELLRSLLPAAPERGAGGPAPPGAVPSDR